MAEFALVSPTDVIDRYETNIDPSVQTKEGWRWLPVDVTYPAFSGATQIRTGPVITLETSRVTRVWEVRDKTGAELSDELTANRDAIVTSVDETEDILRALVLTLLDELNLHALRMTAILNAVDGASTYAALKTAIAAIADVPQRTVAQLRAAIRAKLGT